MKFLFALTLACVVASTFAQFDCGRYERWRSCKQDQTCVGIRLGGPVDLPPLDPCVADCRCRTGRVRDDDDNCVWPEECSQLPACPDSNAVRVSCANRCPGGTCSHPNFSSCFIACEVNGCQCRPGWLKLTSSDPVCIPRELCSLRLGEAGYAASGSASVEAEDDGGYN